MKVGKVSESVLKRCILKQVKARREEVLIGAGVGEDCAALKLAPNETLVVSTDPITGTSKDIGEMAIQITLNDLASSGAEPVGVLLSVLLPPSIEEADIKEMMSQVNEMCERHNVQVVGGHTEITKAVNQVIVTVTGLGKVKDGQIITTAGGHPGQDVVVTKWIGVEGTAIIAKEKEEELKAYFPESFVDTAKAFDQYISVVEDSKIAVKCGVSAMHDVTEGGIFGALWEVAEASKVGLEVDLKAIPIRQETVEICERYDVNPYGLISSGCMLMLAEDGYTLVRELEKHHIKGTVIGKTTDKNDRVLLNEDEYRYLEPPKTDELYKVVG